MQNVRNKILRSQGETNLLSEPVATSFCELEGLIIYSFICVHCYNLDIKLDGIYFWGTILE